MVLDQTRPSEGFLPMQGPGIYCPDCLIRMGWFHAHMHRDRASNATLVVTAFMCDNCHRIETREAVVR